MKKILDYINGNKTLICMVILYAMTLESVKNIVPSDIILLIEYIFGALGFVSVAHKGQKARNLYKEEKLKNKQ